MKIKNIIIGVVALIASFVIGVMVGGNSSQPLGAGSPNRFPNGYIDTGYGYYVDGSEVIDENGNYTGTISSTNSVSTGEFTQGGGIISISTTSATYTLTQAELASGNIISIASVSGAAALALTLPATSSWTTLIPNAGDMRTWGIENLHTAAATTTTITTAAGIQLEGDTANDDIINGGVTGSLTCWRQASTDVVCQVSEKVSAE